MAFAVELGSGDIITVCFVSGYGGFIYRCT